MAGKIELRCPRMRIQPEVREHGDTKRLGCSAYCATMGMSDAHCDEPGTVIVRLS